jgi:hypothetical protein
LCGAIAYAYANCNSATYSNTQRESSAASQAHAASAAVRVLRGSVIESPPEKV